MPFSSTYEQESLLRRRMPPAAVDLAELFHENSKLHRRLVSRELFGTWLLEGNPALLDVSRRASRRYPHLPAVSLPPADPSSAPLAAVIQRRRSRQPVGERALSLSGLSTLLWSGCSFTNAGEHALRAAPSAGALYPLELYVVALDVGDLERGLYHVDPFHHSLEQLDRSITRDTVAAFLSDPHAADRCACLVILCSVMFRTRFKYGLRGYRFALIEAGHVAQNVLLMAAALDVAALPVGGFIDDDVNIAVGCDGVEEVPLYLMALGGDGSATQ